MTNENFEYESQEQVRSYEEISAYESEMFDRVWWVRAHMVDEKTLTDDIRARRQENLDRIAQEQGLVFKKTPVDTWDYGYWSGILAALRWVTGEDKDSLDT